MAQKKTFLQNMAAKQRETERQRAQFIKEQTQSARQALKAHQDYTRAQEAQRRAVTAEQKQRYLELRIAQVEMQNTQLEQTLAQFSTLLTDTLKVDDYIDLETFKQRAYIPSFNPGSLGNPLVPPVWHQPPEPAGMQKMFLGTKQKYQQEVATARQRYEYDFSQYQLAEGRRQAALNQSYAQYNQQVQAKQAEVAAQNQEIEAFQANLRAGIAEAISDYCILVLEASAYPQSFPQKARIAYQPEAKQLVVEYQLPALNIVPTTGSYKYIKTRDEITEVVRPASQINQIYNSIVAQVTLRTMHELFEADRLKHLQTIVFNGVVETVDKSTGRTIWPCLITVQANRATFETFNLAQLDPLECLRGLRASVSKSPSELVPVRPMIEFEKIDKRFIQETDVLSSLNYRTNLLELTPGEFESLITNLFQKMGLDARLTKASGDGGVDCIAYDPRPVVGGKVVIQAKRYKNTVGVAAVRELYGTLLNEGASKGILVATSSYGNASYEFAKDKPLQLVDGTQLLQLLKEYAGVEAIIDLQGY